MTKDVFFGPVFNKSRKMSRPKTIFATGTSTHKIVSLVSRLLTVGLPPDAIIWASANDFVQRNVAMKFVSSAQLTRHLYTVVQHGKDTTKGFIYVFVGLRDKSHLLTLDLDRNLNEALQTIGVVHVHGSLDKMEKYCFIQMM